MKSKDLEKLIEGWRNFGIKHKPEGAVVTFDSFLDGNSLAARMSSNSEFIWDVMTYNADIILLAACNKYAEWHIPEVSMKFQLDKDTTFIFAPIEKGKEFITSTDDISLKGRKSIGYNSPTIYELCWNADHILKQTGLKLEDVFEHTYFENSRSHNYPEYKIKNIMAKLPDEYPVVQLDEPDTACEKICEPDNVSEEKEERKLYAEN